MFEKYGQVRSRHHGRLRERIGLRFCRVAAEAHGGSIRLEERDELPVPFLISLLAEASATRASFEPRDRSAS